MRISIDTSLLAHAMIASQTTPQAVAALREIRRDGHEMFCSPGLYMEFPSALRRMVNQQVISASEAGAILADFMNLRITPLLVTLQRVQRSWEVASRLGQSDTFDAMGYVVAEEIDGEFWTSDQRFANAARNAGLTRVRLVP